MTNASASATDPARVRSGRAGVALLWVACLVGALAVLVAGVALWVVDASCPDWEDEGSMAAPSSLYSRVMCGPGEPPLTWSVWVPLALAALVAWLVQRRWRATRSRGLLVGRILSLLVAPTVVLGVLHLSLPQDCFSGRTETGDCSRDREMR